MPRGRELIELTSSAPPDDVGRRGDLVGTFAGMVMRGPASWCQLQRASLGKLLNLRSTFVYRNLTLI